MQQVCALNFNGGHISLGARAGRQSSQRIPHRSAMYLKQESSAALAKEMGTDIVVKRGNEAKEGGGAAARRPF